MNLSKRYFKIIDYSNIPFKNMHNIRNRTTQKQKSSTTVIGT